jgi:hypothetical protein
MKHVDETAENRTPPSMSQHVEPIFSIDAIDCTASSARLGRNWSACRVAHATRACNARDGRAQSLYAANKIKLIREIPNAERTPMKMLPKNCRCRPLRCRLIQLLSGAPYLFLHLLLIISCISVCITRILHFTKMFWQRGRQRRRRRGRRGRWRRGRRGQ